jgi:hypothetical protein
VSSISVLQNGEQGWNKFILSSHFTLWWVTDSTEMYCLKLCIQV